MSAVAPFNPLARAFLADPYPDFHRLRQEDPVHRCATGAWILTRYDDIKAVVNDARFRAPDIPARIAGRGRRAPGSGPNLDHLIRVTRGFLNFFNPPEHTLSRGAARAGFALFAPASLTLLCRQVIGELIAALPVNRPVDLVAEFTEPLAGRTIGRVMGLSDADTVRVQALSHRVATVVDSLLPLEAYRDMNAAAGELLGFFDEALARARPEDGFLGAFSGAAEDAGTRQRLAALAAFIFIAGEETTVNSLANSIVLLAQNETCRNEMLAAPETATHWVHELLRYESPIQLIPREATAGVELRGRSIQPGERLILYLGAGNRDPAVFAEPDRLDFSRDARGHLAFSAGIHRCIGAPLATEEMQQGLRALFGRFPQLAIQHSAVRRRRGDMLRGYAQLPAHLAP